VKPSSSTPIRFLVYPSLGEVQEHVRAEFLGRILAERLGRPVLVDVAPTYERVEEELAAGRVDIAWATAEQCDRFELEAWAVLRAVRVGRWYYHAALICRADAPLSLQTLRGKKAAWVAPLSTGGHLLAERHLTELGLPPAEVFSEQRFLGSYKRVLQAVLNGEADVTSVYASHADEHTVRAFLAERLGADERRLMPFAFTGQTLSDGLILTRRLPREVATTLVSLLTEMSEGGSGLDVHIAPFHAEGFVLPLAAPPASASRPPRRSEYLLLELDRQELCQRVWASGGTAFGRVVAGKEGRPLADVLGPEASIPLVALARAARHRGVGGRVEYGADVDSQPRWFSAEATPLPAMVAGERASGTTLLVRDITDSRALESELYRLASFPLLYPEPLLELERDGSLRYANRAAHMAFPDLLARGSGHPVVQEALAQAAGPAGSPPRTLEYEGMRWELSVVLPPDSEHLRVFARDAR
jgi:ABC-type phosphate/phosphonate transport system substrate-binding protein